MHRGPGKGSRRGGSDLVLDGCSGESRIGEDAQLAKQVQAADSLQD